MPVPARSICASLLLALACGRAAAAQEAISTRLVSGTVLDARGTSGIAGARVHLSAIETSAVTDSTGRFVFEAVPPGRYHLTVELEGFAAFESPAEVAVVADADPPPIVIHYELRLATQVNATAQALAAGERGAGSTLLNTLPGRAVAMAPGALEDVMRAFQMRPGVAPSQDDRNDMLVRGGGAIENAVRVDGFDVPNPNHFGTPGGSGGGFSFIAPTLIDSATLRAGGFPVEFGERASSVLDLSLRRGAADRVHGQLGASIGGAMAEGDGPIGGGGSWLVSARRAFLDLVLKHGNDVAIPHYSDVVGRADATVRQRHHVELLTLYSVDNVTVNPDRPADSLEDNQRSALVGASLLSQWSPVTTSRLYLSYTRSSIDGVMHGTTTDQGSDRSTEIEVRARAEVTRRLARDARLVAGLSVKQAYLRYDLVAKSFVSDFGQYRKALNSHVPFTFADFGAYADARLPALGHVQVTPGIRVDRRGTTGRFYASPRLNAEYQAARWLRMTAATGVYRQDIPYIWMGSDPRNAALDPVRSVQTLAGFAFELPGRTFVTIEGFDKRYSGYPVDPIEWWHVLVDASADFESPFVGHLSADGTLHAQGADASLERRFGRFEVHTSYSWWRVTQKTGRWPFVFGKGRPGDYDIRDQVRLDLAYHAPRKWRAAAQFRYATGRPYTPHDVRASIITGAGRYNLMAFNASTYPAYHRLDLRADHTFAIGRTALIAYVEVENVYNRDNVVTYQWSRAARADRPVYQWGRLPIAGVRWEF